MPSLKECLARNYPVVVERDEETENYVLRVPDLRGCVTHGETIQKAFRRLEEAKRVWIEDRLEKRQEVPPPRGEADYSGQFVLRLPKSLHRRLAEVAAADDVSLNTCAVAAVAQYVGWRDGQSERRGASARPSKRSAATAASGLRRR